MKTTAAIWLVCLLVPFAAARDPNQAGSPRGEDSGRKRPRVTQNNNVMVLEYEFAEPELVTEGGVDGLAIDGFERYVKPGAPVIPVKPVEILVPAGMKIAGIESVAVNPEQRPGTYRLAHGTAPRFRSPYGKEARPVTPTRPDPVIYSMTGFWPARQHRLVTVQTNRGYDLAHVVLFPLQYAPRTGKVRMATKMRLKVFLEAADSVHRAKPTRDLTKKLNRLLENPDAMDSYDIESAAAPSIPGNTGSPLDLTGPYHYVVITSTALAGLSDPYSFQALCDSKIARGIPAGIVTTEWIYANYGGTDHAEKIRNFLIDAYETWATEYALLGGNKDIVPVRILWDEGYDIASDLYYGCVDPSACTFDNDGDGKYGESHDGPGGGDVDLTAEIFTGRAAVETQAEVMNFVRKTLVYETMDDPYLNEAGTMGSYLGFGGIQEFTKPFAELIRHGSSAYLGHHTYGFEDAVVPHARTFNITTLYDEDWYNEHYDPDYHSATAGSHDGVSWNWNTMGWDATTELIPYLNGTGGHTTPHLLYISDHGAWNWGMVKIKTTATSEFNCDHLGNVNNTRPFFFYDDSCNVGQFDHADCFGEVITTMEHGAFACILNSRDGLGGEGNTLDSPSTQMTREFFHSVLGEGIFELGRAHQEAKESCIWRLGSMDWLRYVYFEVSLFGDPELRLRVTADADTTPPTPNPMTFAVAPHATGAGSIAMQASVATDTENGVEYLFTCTAGGGHDSGWQNSPNYTDTGLDPDTEYSYTVTARDKSANRNTTAASAALSATTPLDLKNLVLAANGGVLESFTSEYGSGWVASDLNNGVTDEEGWSSTKNPGNQEFVYSFIEGKDALLHEAVIHSGTGEGKYFSKDVEVWTSPDGTGYTIAASGTLANSVNAIALDLGGRLARRVKLVITSGYRSDYWELGEFEVQGVLATDYDVWRGTWPAADLGDPKADFDRDGLSNAEERIWGLNPTSAASCKPVMFPPHLASGTFAYTRRTRALTGLGYTVWTSPDLHAWTEDTGAVQTPGAPVNEVETVTVALSPARLGAPRLFVQVRAAS